MDKKFIIGIFAAVAVSMAIVIVPWACTFYNSTFSKDPASWGSLEITLEVCYLRLFQSLAL